MFYWEKLGRVFEPQMVKNIWWMKHFAQAPSVLELSDRIRVFFSTRPDPDANGQYLSYLGYVDLDKADLFRIVDVSKRPVIELGNLGTFDEFGINPASVIKDKDEIRIYYAGWSRCESVTVNAAIGMAISKNSGVRFTRLGDGPVLSYSINEPFVLGSPRVRRFGDKWYMWYVAGSKWVPNDRGNPEPIYKIRMAESIDGINWLKYGKDLISPVLGDQECQASPEVIEKGGLYHMFFSYRHNFDFKTKEKGYRIGYASSLDLKNWRRNDSFAGIDLSDDGWDSEMVSYPCIFNLQQTTYMLYQGNQIGRTGFGLAKLIGI